MSVVHRTGYLTSERNHHVILHLIHRSRTPFHLFQTIDTFKVQYIRVSTIQTGRFVRSVQVEDQFVFSTHFGSPIIECSHKLIVTIHKIDLKTFYSHVGIMTANVLHITLESIITGPKNDAYIFGGCIIYQFFQINLFHHLHQIRLQIYRPAFVKYHIFNTVCRSKINVGFISRIIYSGHKINAIQIPSIPPVPCYFAGFDP